MRLEGFRVLVVIVNIIDICFHMVAAAGIDTRAGGVRRLCCAIHGSKNVVALLSVVAVPGLVEGAPADDRRMVEIAGDLFQPFLKNREHAFRPGMIQPPVGVFAPDKIAQLVGVIKEPRFKDLFVEPIAMERSISPRKNASVGEV